MTLLNRSIAVALFVASLVDLNQGNPAFPQQSVQCTKDKYRPRYHFSPQKSWINDPNGMIYYDGTYHLFYQYHPHSMVWGPMHWGHAVSKNLVNWEELEIALEPDDIGDIFSGSSVLDNLNTAGFKAKDNDSDPIVAIYTSALGEKHETQRQSLAYSLDKGMTFQKYEGNPVLEAESKDFRDPKVFFHNGKWIMSLSVGSKIEFYSSSNLKSWKKESEFGASPPVGSHQGVWECPDLIPLNADVSDKLTIEQWALLVSINPGAPNGGSATQYFIGNFTANNTDAIAFHSNPFSEAQWLDWGPDNYAGVTFSNEPNGRFIYMGWMSNWFYADSTPTSSWRGQMTLPRELSLRVLNHDEKQYRLVSTPVKELEALRNPLQHLEHNQEEVLEPQSSLSLTDKADFKTPLMELDIMLEVENNAQFAICAGNSLNEEVCFGLNRGGWFLDRSKSGNINFHSQYTSTLKATGLREITEKQIPIRMFLDVSSIEVFADGGLTTMTALVYLSEPFDRLFVRNLNHISTTDSLKIINYNIWGLLCWFEETNEDQSQTTPGTGGAQMNAMSFYSISSIVLVTIAYYSNINV